MGPRLTGALIAVALLFAAFATTASAQQVGPGGPDAEVTQYLLPEAEISQPGGEEPVPSLGGAGPSGEVGAAGNLPFTGMWLLPLVTLGITFVLVALAIRRRGRAVPALG